MTEVSSTRLYLGNLPRNGMLELPTLDGCSTLRANALDEEPSWIRDHSLLRGIWRR